MSNVNCITLLTIAATSLLLVHEHAAAAMSSAEYWGEVLPDMALPAELSGRVTALDGSNAAVASQLYESLLSSGGPTSNICAAGHLYCSSQQFDAFRLVLATCGIQVGFRNPNLMSQKSSSVVNFFRENELVVGAHMALGDQRDRAPPAPFLPRQLANALLPASAELLQTAFGIPAKSLLGEESLRTSALCTGGKAQKEQLLKGEEAFCALSLEGLADQLNVRFAESKQKVALLPVSLPASAANAVSIDAKLVQVELRRAEAEQPYLVCHAQTYPFAVYFCHHIPDTRIYSARLQTVGGPPDIFQAVAICHSDTSEWNPSHTAFADLHSAPGLTEACHWTHEHGLVFVPAAN